MAKQRASKKWDIDALHHFLWRHTAPNGRLLLSHTELADMFGVTPAVMTYVFRTLQEEERVYKQGKFHFVVINPEVWVWSRPAPVVVQHEENNGPARPVHCSS